MPYCSIEEAWGEDFINDNTDDKFNKIVPENSYDSESNNFTETSDNDLYD